MTAQNLGKGEMPPISLSLPTTMMQLIMVLNSVVLLLRFWSWSTNSNHLTSLYVRKQMA